MMNNFSRPFRPGNSWLDSSERVDVSYASDSSHETSPDVGNGRGSVCLVIQNLQDEMSAHGEGSRPRFTRPLDHSDVDASSHSSQARMHWKNRIKPLLLPMFMTTC